MVNSVVNFTKTMNENTGRSYVNQLSTTYNLLMGKVDDAKLAEFSNLIEVISKAQREINVLLGEMGKSYNFGN